MAVPSDFTLDWDLPEYTQLPKMFTNAKAAKKRKHKEFIMTDAELDQVVKIPKAAKGTSTEVASVVSATTHGLAAVKLHGTLAGQAVQCNHAMQILGLAAVRLAQQMLMKSRRCSISMLRC